MPLISLHALIEKNVDYEVIRCLKSVLSYLFIKKYFYKDLFDVSAHLCLSTSFRAEIKDGHSSGFS